MEEKKDVVVLVNQNDEEIGEATKEEAHLGEGKLHRAFTVLLFNEKKEVLLQKRSKEKLLWPLTWEASCSSHPLKNEGYVEAGERRLKEELGINVNLNFLTKFQYYQKYKDIGAEWEICALLIGNYNGKINPNPKEVSEVRWFNTKDLLKEFETHPHKFAPWLKIALNIYLKLRD